MISSDHQSPSASSVSDEITAAGTALLSPPDRQAARGYHRVLRVAPLADLDAAATVARHHIVEALSYRRPVPVPEGASGLTTYFVHCHRNLVIFTVILSP